MANLNQRTGRSTWIHARHVDLLDKLLVELHARELLRNGFRGLLIEEPPRHGKSELTTHYDTVYYLGSHPEDRVVIVSYESEFAASWGRKTRNTMEEFGHFYGLSVDPRSSAANRWDLKGAKGGVITAGVGGGITGRGANFLKIDDPIKNYQEAQSETIRDNHWDWFTSTAYSRLEPDAIVVVIMTRWHEDDLIGRILAAQGESPEGKNHPLFDPDAERYIRVRLPAIAEAPDEDFPDPDMLGRVPGEALFPERYPADTLRTIRATQGEVKWNALYQQRPSDPEGGLFKVNHMKIVPHPGGRFRRLLRFWDTAATDPKEADDPDYTVGLLLGEHVNGLYYVLDVQRFRESPGETERRVLSTTHADGHRVRGRMEQEPGSQGKLYVRHLGKKLRGYAWRGIPSTGPKMLRAEVVAAAVEREEIHIVRAPWNRAFIMELRKFPNAKHDDQVDAFGGAWQQLTSRGKGFQSF